jgi:predicted  nucleic acid-binding Zn-ribbon protein
MDAHLSQEGNGGKKFTTPRWVQAWFLGRSRDKWKAKYKALKAEAKRLANRVNDVSKSREHWRQQVRALREENAVLREQAALKKYGPSAPTVEDR